MKVVRFHEHGGLDVLRHEEIPDSEPGSGEVLVKVRACALNHLDLLLNALHDLADVILLVLVDFLFLVYNQDRIVKIPVPCKTRICPI